jgi:hypothetical protein
LSAIQKLFTSVRNKGKFPDQWKESSILPIHKKGDKTDCNNYRVISLLSTSYKLLPKVRSVHRLNYWGSPVWVST